MNSSSFLLAWDSWGADRGLQYGVELGQEETIEESALPHGRENPDVKAGKHLSCPREKQNIDLSYSYKNDPGSLLGTVTSDPTVRINAPGSILRVVTYVIG
jgi:hypothetical protein